VCGSLPRTRTRTRSESLLFSASPPAGTRTFLESDADNPRRRLDLMRKMASVDGSSLTEEERISGVTKLRYMQFREVRSSTATLGWRVEGVRRVDDARRVSTYPAPKLLQSRPELEGALRWFCQRRPAVRAAFTRQLEALQAALESSSWFASNELVSSSLLFLYDDFLFSTAPPGIWMIDFAKTVPLPPGQTLTHRAPWSPGNREDGYLTGIESLLDMYKGLNLDQAEPPTLPAAAGTGVKLRPPAVADSGELSRLLRSDV